MADEEKDEIKFRKIPILLELYSLSATVTVDPVVCSAAKDLVGQVYEHSYRKR